MKQKYLALIGLVSFVIIGCNNAGLSEQTNESSIAEATPILETPANVETPANLVQKNTNAKSGTFVAGEHSTEGTVRIVTEDGQSTLELDQAFKTSEMGPDLVVVLHRSDNVIGSTTPPAYPLKEGDYVVIAPLKKFSGTQSYKIPNDVNLENYKSVAIWCRKFNATFGAAKLET
jgi:hypothetical protein